MKWNTDKIVNDLNEILKDVKITTNDYPEGGHYCRDIYVSKSDDDDDSISIVGFIDDGDLSDVDTPNENIELVEIRNLDSDSDGGLQTKDKQLRNIYHKICDYFNDKGCEVVRTIEDYF